MLIKKKNIEIKKINVNVYIISYSTLMVGVDAFNYIISSIINFISANFNNKKKMKN
jgi:hypothetical protein